MPLHDQYPLPLEWPQALTVSKLSTMICVPASCCLSQHWLIPTTLLLQGYSAVRFQRSDADALWKLRAMPPDQFGRAWQLSDVDCDGALSRAEFILFMYFVGSFSRK